MNTSDAAGTATDRTAMRRLALALELSETALAMMRQNLRRRDPAADEATIDARFRRWLASGGGHPQSHFKARAGLR